MSRPQKTPALPPDLAGLSLGGAAPIREIEGPGPLVERLYEMGFTPGESVSLIARAPFGGPWVVRVRDITVALRNEEARCLLL